MKRILGFLAATSLLLSACGGKLQSPDFDPVLKGIEIAPAMPAVVAIGGSLQLTANGLYTVPPGSDVDATRGSVTGVQWVSDNTAIATVDSTGKVTGLACSTPAPVRIRARAQGFEKTVDVTVGGVVLRQINVAPSSFTVHVGESKEYTATGVYRDCAGNTRAGGTITQPVSWSITDPSIADLVANGASVVAKAKAVTAGTKVQARATNEEGVVVLGEANLVVNPALLKDLVVSGVSVSPPYRLPVGSSINFQVMGIYSDSSTPRPVPSSPSPVTWTSGNSARATFATDISNTQNALTAKTKDADAANNVFNITVSAPDGEGAVVTASQPLQITISDAVLQSVTDIVASSGIAPLRVARGLSLQLVARGMFSDGTTVDVDPSLVAWSVAAGASPAGAASITNFSASPAVGGGLLTGTTIGNIDITATANSATNTKTVTRAAMVTDPICVVPYIDPATAAGTVTGGACLGTCAAKDSGNLVTASTTDFATMTIGTGGSAETVLKFTVTGPSVTGAPGQKAGFIVAYAGTTFDAASIKVSAGGGTAITPEVSTLDPTSDGLNRRLVRVVVAGTTFTSLAAQVTVAPSLALPLPPLPLPSLPLPTASTDVRFYSACSTAQSP